MASVVEATGKTVADALRSALQQLGCEETDVDYEVLEAPSKGFLGFFGKDARIKVTKKEKAAESVAVEPATTSLEEIEAEAVTETVATAEVSLSAAEQLARAEKFLRDVFAAMGIEVTWQKSWKKKTQRQKLLIRKPLFLLQNSWPGRKSSCGMCSKR